MNDQVLRHLQEFLLDFGVCECLAFKAVVFLLCVKFFRGQELTEAILDTSENRDSNVFEWRRRSRAVSTLLALYDLSHLPYKELVYYGRMSLLVAVPEDT